MGIEARYDATQNDRSACRSELPARTQNGSPRGLRTRAGDSLSAWCLGSGAHDHQLASVPYLVLGSGASLVQTIRHGVQIGVEQIGVDVERHGGAGMPEDALHSLD